ncbi:MAG: amidohydrolase family protein [Atopobiaceae bacterium]|jgi:predicted TIM-barrel fold metal-dependent hydrolase|nr:amidohydrolase family protein [Atopobiaceae bacterium]MCI2172641.1 amidohydrolase family protein [Atopobiaceae bacterium]MCI2206948.1 amidohydrolase family protein [Atopobiaceae bacterium]
MIIDMHVHPLLYDAIYDEDGFSSWEREFGMGLMGPMGYDEVLVEMDVGGIDRSVLLPLDLTTTAGITVASNEQVRSIVSDHPDRFVGFASVDPHREDAAAVVEGAFSEGCAAGLALNPAKQGFSVDEACMDPIFELCERFDRPIMFHAGMSWEPGALAVDSHPLLFERAIAAHPSVRMCLAHFAWPWVREMVMLMLKYPNVYTDTSVLYLDSPEESIRRLFTVDMGPLWVERSLSSQVMFASNTPRFRAFKIRRALDQVEMSDSTREAIMGGNALRFLGVRECDL